MQTRRVIAVVVLAFVICLAFAAPAFAGIGPVRKIVRFQTGALNEHALNGLTKRHAKIVRRLPLIDGVAVLLPSEAVAKGLLGEPGVVSVSDDFIVTALGKPAPAAPPAEALQWGVTRVGAPLVWSFTMADPIKVGIVDTGISTTHPDLLANLKGGVSFVGNASSYNDDNGHGTHVAGIVAAADNEIGVIGVAPKVDLYAIKVLNRKGSGYTSDIIAGLDWAKNNGIKVVNMSLGSNYYSSDFALAVQRLAAAGVVEVCAAGNDGPGAVDYPGAYPEAIAVGATNSSNLIASWSSVGPQVAVAAPGVSVYSTYKGTGYATLSGTSMASPHVAGTVALMLTQPDPDGNGWEPAEVKAKLQATALPLGAQTSFGAGLVQAGAAVAP